MAVYDMKGFSTPFNLDDDHRSCNGTAISEHGAGASGLWVTSIRQKAVLNSMISIIHSGTLTPTAGSATNFSGIAQVDVNGTLRTVVAGGLAMSTATGQALVDTLNGNTNTTNNKINLGWFTATDGEKYLAICNTIDGQSVAVNTLAVKPM